MKDGERAHEILAWAWAAIRGWSPQVLAAAGAILSMIWGRTGGAVLMWVTVALLVAALVAQLVQRPTYTELAADKRRAEDLSDERATALERAMTTLLRELCRHLNVSGDEDRVSIYYHDDDRFVMIARWSRNPVYKKPGRKVYPAQQGVIGQVWGGPGSLLVELPSTDGRWRKEVLKQGYSNDEIDALSMKSKQIAAARVAYAEQPVGVIVLESTRGGTITQSTIDALLESLLYTALAELVAVAARVTPRGEQILAAPAPNRERPWVSLDPQRLGRTR